MSLQCKSLMRKKRVSFIIVRCPYCKSGIIIIVKVRKGVPRFRGVLIERFHCILLLPALHEAICPYVTS